MQERLPVPVQAVISDGERSVRRAVEAELPGIPHQVCQFHYLREAAKPIVEADRHARKELGKHLRGLRPLERSLEGQEGPEAQAAQGYCLAVRSALTDDAHPPLDPPGLRLRTRLESIAASLERVAQKRGCRPN